MRRTIAAVLCVLLSAQILPAQGSHDWSTVEKLKRRTPVLVVLWSGERVSGRIVRADKNGVELAERVRWDPGTGALREIRRRDIRTVERVRRDENLPNPRTYMVGGAVVGGAAGLGIGIYRDKRDKSVCRGACSIVDTAAGATLGFLGGSIVGLTVGVGHVLRRNVVVYEDNSQRPPRE